MSSRSRFALLASAFPTFLITAFPPAHAVPAFPGAEGFGTDTPGGRGGRVYEVTTLEDCLVPAAGCTVPVPGSLREALQASGPRIIVFRVGGTIEIDWQINVRNPYVTIAGQTAPGGGIAIRNGPTDTLHADLDPDARRRHPPRALPPRQGGPRDGGERRAQPRQRSAPRRDRPLLAQLVGGRGVRPRVEQPRRPELPRHHALVVDPLGGAGPGARHLAGGVRARALLGRARERDGRAVPRQQGGPRRHQRLAGRDDGARLAAPQLHGAQLRPQPESVRIGPLGRRQQRRLRPRKPDGKRRGERPRLRAGAPGRELRRQLHQAAGRHELRLERGAAALQDRDGAGIPGLGRRQPGARQPDGTGRSRRLPLLGLRGGRLLRPGGLRLVQGGIGVVVFPGDAGPDRARRARHRPVRCRSHACRRATPWTRASSGTSAINPPRRRARPSAPPTGAARPRAISSRAPATAAGPGPISPAAHRRPTPTTTACRTRGRPSTASTRRTAATARWTQTATLTPMWRSTSTGPAHATRTTTASETPRTTVPSPRTRHRRTATAMESATPATTACSTTIPSSPTATTTAKGTPAT